MGVIKPVYLKKCSLHVQFHPYSPPFIPFITLTSLPSDLGEVARTSSTCELVWSHCLCACSFLVGEDGNVYEGRGWTTVGAHAPRYNTKSIGLSFIGNFSSTFLLSNHRLYTLQYLLCLIHLSTRTSGVLI